MQSYFFICIAISLLVRIIIKYGKATSNANYYLSALAITAWFIPYSYIAELIPTDVLQEPVIIAISQVSVVSILSSAQNHYYDLEQSLKWGLWALLGIGFVILVTRVARFHQWRSEIINDPSLTAMPELSTKHQVPIYSLHKVSSGLLLGIFNPVIIMSTSITEPKHIALIIAHEKQHRANNDNFRLMLLEVAECLFWWNPIVRKLINTNRFYIEARCDENTSKALGYSNYIEGLASLIILSHTNKLNTLACTATSNNKNNIARMKLLQENRKMTLRKKLAYLFITMTAITTLSWNTIATAITNEQSQQLNADQTKLGALVDFEAIIEKKNVGVVEHTYKNKIVIWVDFDKKVAIKVSDNVTVNFKAKDLGESVFLEYELIESTKTNEETIVEPKLTVNYGEQGVIEIDNPQLSDYAYLIKTTPSKASHPVVADNN